MSKLADNIYGNVIDVAYENFDGFAAWFDGQSHAEGMELKSKLTGVIEAHLKASGAVYITPVNDIDI